MSWLISFSRGALSSWNWFWFDSRSDSSLVPLAAFRLLFCSVMLFCYFTRGLDLDFFYSADGIMPYWHLANVDFFRYHPTFLTDSWGLGALHALHALFLLLLLFQAAGLFTRYSAIGVYILHMAFTNRNMSVMFGVDMIATFFLLYLCFADTNGRFSLDAIRGKGAKRQSAMSHIALRLMQLQVCIVYAYSGLEKLKGTRWWDGSALWDVLSIGNMQRWDLSFVSHFPVLLAAGVYVVLAWEIYFPVLVWLRKFRLPMLFFGAFMHVGIFLFMNLPSFGFMMITLYLLFLTKEEILQGFERVAKALRVSRPIRS
jgi:hypothetical protein